MYDPGNFVIGAFKGKKIKDCPLRELYNLYLYIKGIKHKLTIEGYHTRENLRLFFSIPENNINLLEELRRIDNKTKGEYYFYDGIFKGMRLEDMDDEKIYFLLKWNNDIIQKI